MIDNYKPIFSREQIMTILKKGIRKNASSNKNGPKSDSPYGQKLRESKKISLFYGGLSKKYMQKINHKSVNMPSKASENIFIALESRLDVILYRSGFFESIKSAKQMVRIGGIKVNKNIVISPGYFVTPGDIITVFGKYYKKNRCCDIQKKETFPQKNISFVNKGHLKKNRQHIGEKEKVDICKTFIKIKNQILTRKEIRSHYKGSSMLLSTISLASVYSGKLKAYKNNIDITTDVKTIKNKTTELFPLVLTLPQSTYFDKTIRASTPMQQLRENDFAKEIKKANGFGLCLVLLNTIRNIIDLKNDNSLEKRITDNNKKQSPFFNRLTRFNRLLKIDKFFPQLSGRMSFITDPFVSNGLQKGLPKTTKNTAKIENKDKQFKQFNYQKQHPMITDNNDRALRRTPVISENPSDSLFLLLNYLVNLKKQYSLLQKKKISNKKQQQILFFKNQNFFDMKKTKVPHLEVSYKSLSIVFLFPPQRVNFPSFFNASLIYK